MASISPAQRHLLARHRRLHLLQSLRQLHHRSGHLCGSAPGWRRCRRTGHRHVGASHKCHRPAGGRPAAGRRPAGRGLRRSEPDAADDSVWSQCDGLDAHGVWRAYRLFPIPRLGARTSAPRTRQAAGPLCGCDDASRVACVCVHQVVAIRV